jgi:hypothetical protein
MSWAACRIERRLRKLEGPQGTELEQLTADELQIYLLEVSRAILADESVAQDKREARERRIAEIEADIIKMATKQASPEYARHLEWCRARWRGRTGQNDYVPALTGSNNGFGEYSDWEKPDVMANKGHL